MNQEEIKKYIQVGCVVKIGADRNEYTVTDINNEALCVKGHTCSYGFGSIREIISWPKPKIFTEEHIGHYVQQSFNLRWKKIVPNTQIQRRLGTEITIFYANKTALSKYTPIMQPQEPKPLLLKDCPVWSFVKLKSKEGLNTPWSQIINKSTHEIMVSQDGSEGSPDPESEVLELIDKIEDIPEHAIVRTRNSMKYTTIKEFQGKFSDIAAIITDPAVNKNRGIHLGDLIYLDKSWHRATNLTFPSKSELTRLSDGAKVDLADSNLKYVQMIRKPEEINKDWWVKVMAGEKEPRTPTWFPASGLDLYSTGLAKILDISTTYPNKQNIDIKVGDWVKHFDFDGWQQVVASTNGISVNDRKGSGDHGFYSKERIIDHKKITVISNQQWSNVRLGMWVKIADDFFIKSKLDKNGWYDHNDYSDSKIDREAGKWMKIHRLSNGDSLCGPGTGYWHKDFIVDISETEPVVYTNARTGAESSSTTPVTLDEKSELTEEQCKKLIYDKAVKDIIYSPTSWQPGKRSLYANKAGLAAQHINACKEVPLGDDSLHQAWSRIDEAFPPLEASNKEYWMFFNMNENKQEKIMLNTVEQIKEAEISAELLQKAAEETKKVREERISKQVMAKQQEILEQVDGLNEQKKQIEKAIAQKEELLKALGYPPK